MSEAQVVEAKQASNVVTSENLTEWTLNRMGLATEEAPTEAEAVEETPESEPVAEEGIYEKFHLAADVLTIPEVTCQPAAEVLTANRAVAVLVNWAEVGTPEE